MSTKTLAGTVVQPQHSPYSGDPAGKMLYLCGPMSGYPDDNRAAFRDAATRLRRAGYGVWSPAEHWDPTQGWAAAMHMDLTAVLAECDRLAILDGWWASRGAMVEIQVAGAVGYPVRPVADWIALAARGNVPMRTPAS